MNYLILLGLFVVAGFFGNRPGPMQMVVIVLSIIVGAGIFAISVPLGEIAYLVFLDMLFGFLIGCVAQLILKW